MLHDDKPNQTKTITCTTQIEIEEAERYRYDGECLIAAEEMGKPGLVEIRQKQDTFIFRVGLML